MLTSRTSPSNHSQSIKATWTGRRIACVLAGVLAEAVLIRLGQTYGSTRQERAMRLLGDAIVPNPMVVTNHAVTIDAPSDCVWPWLMQMGWPRAGWYTARWVDKLLFPLNWPSATESSQSCNTSRLVTSFQTAPRRPRPGSSWRSWSPGAPWHSIPQVICQ